MKIGKTLQNSRKQQNYMTTKAKQSKAEQSRGEQRSANQRTRAHRVKLELTAVIVSSEATEMQGNSWKTSENAAEQCDR